MTAAQEFLAELDGFARRRCELRTALSARWLKTAAGIGTDAARGVQQYQLALPPDAFRRLVDLGGPDGRDGEAADEVRSLARAYLCAYADSFESATGSPERDLSWGRRCAGRPAETAAAAMARSVEVISQRNLRDANILLDTRAGSAHDLRLRDLYVPRALERHDRLRCKDPSVTVVVGEAGAGKTSLLWRLGEVFTTRGDRPLLLKATDLVPRSPGGDPGVGIDALRAALGEGPADRVPILLVDTVDLLLRSGSVPAVLRDLLDVATDTGTALVLTCRIREFRSLRDDFDLHDLPLGPYEKDELTRAIEGHARHFHSCSDADLRQVTARVLVAVARGLPLFEICRRPLTLRMLFELAQFDTTDEQRPEIDTEIDVTDLYERYWQIRVRDDVRGHRREAEELDAAPAGELLATLMLAAGRPTIDAAAIDAELVTAPGWAGQLGAGVAALRRRGVLQDPDDASPAEFFHQTFFEYAAARAVTSLGDTGMDLRWHGPRNSLPTFSSLRSPNRC